MKTSSPPLPSAPWAERYETLRQSVLGGGRLWESPPLGLALWLARGMAGWMGQWAQAMEKTVSPARVPLALCPGPAQGWQRQVTLILAGMTLGQLQTESSP